MYDLERVEELYYILHLKAHVHVDPATSNCIKFNPRDFPAKSAIAARAMTSVLTCSQQHDRRRGHHEAGSH